MRHTGQVFLLPQQLGPYRETSHALVLLNDGEVEHRDMQALGREYSTLSACIEETTFRPNERLGKEAERSQEPS